MLTFHSWDPARPVGYPNGGRRIVRSTPLRVDADRLVPGDDPVPQPDGYRLVATDGGALPEVTGTDGETVLGCKAGDVESLAAAIRRGLDDADLRARIGAAGRQRVVERWSWKHCAQLTVDQYREVLAMPHNVEKLRRNGRI